MTNSDTNPVAGHNSRRDNENTPMQNKTVLIADDNPGIVDLLTVVLSDIGLSTEAAMTGGEVLQKAKNLQPDLILLDIMMPVMDGWEVATRLLTDSRTADIPIIFLTARAGVQEQLRGWRMPVFEYITKPFEIDDLLHKVEEVLKAEPEQRTALRERLRREKLRTLMGMEAQQ